MRSLKFRVWWKNFSEPTVYTAYDFFDDTWTTHEYIAIEQYTGLKDKNGKEIYEGDILQDESNDTAVVIWREHQAEWGIKWMRMGIEDSLRHRMEWGNLNEVIGNIHSNPELLEQDNAKD